MPARRSGRRDWQPCVSPATYTSLAAGLHSFEVRAGDELGNFDLTPAAVDFFVDIPVNGQRVAVVPLTGTVRIKTPDARRFRPLTEGETIPVGSVIDTRQGKVRLVSANATAEEQSAAFLGGIFRVQQQLGYGLVKLRLRGRLGACGGDDEGASTSARRSKRRLCGSGKGQYRTVGSYGSATVRGTAWLTEDRCGGTFFKVRRGVVSVRDFPHRRTVSVPAGATYFAQRGG